MLDQLRQIAIFAKTAEHGSFRKAADALQLSPSVVSHHVAKLESQLGVALIYRSTRKLTLTPAGRKLLHSASAMLESAESFFQVATEQQMEVIGEMTIALPAVLEYSPLVSHIGDFSKLHLGVQINMEFSDQRVDLIERGADLAIRMGWLADSSLKAVKLYDVERCVVATAAYAQSKPVPMSVADLSSWDWIALSAVGLGRIFAGRIDGFYPTGRLRVSSANAMHQLVLNGNGIAALPRFLVQAQLDRGDLVAVLSDAKIEGLGVYAVWPNNVTKGSLTQRLVSYLQEAYRRQG
ncbi:MAG: LysR family transcriptional regulator [Gammaproteobacteria bacterium]|nr:LysR family transcriptional regulator [Gammaproteobacteria bacterium]